MGDKTKISWTDATWNPVTGCTKVSAGCKNCYAEREWPRLAGNPKTVYYQRPFTDVQFHPERLHIPLQWKRPRMIFVNSMSDLFHPRLKDEQIACVFNVMVKARWHIFQVLTKRSERMPDFLSWYVRMTGVTYSQMGHIWLGTSVENQEWLRDRMRYLENTPAPVKWLSLEPLLGPLDLRDYFTNAFDIHPEKLFTPEAVTPRAPVGQFKPWLNWVVVGGESGPKARPMKADWVRIIRDQCVENNIPFFFKQWGEWLPMSQAIRQEEYYFGGIFHDFGNGIMSKRLGTKNAGHSLDGVEWHQYPITK